MTLTLAQVIGGLVVAAMPEAYRAVWRRRDRRPRLTPQLEALALDLIRCASSPAAALEFFEQVTTQYRLTRAAKRRLVAALGGAP